MTDHMDAHGAKNEEARKRIAHWFVCELHICPKAPLTCAPPRRTRVLAEDHMGKHANTLQNINDERSEGQTDIQSPSTHKASLSHQKTNMTKPPRQFWLVVYKVTHLLGRVKKQDDTQYFAGNGPSYCEVSTTDMSMTIKSSVLVAERACWL
jgi:hypothetical protein